MPLSTNAALNASTNIAAQASADPQKLAASPDRSIGTTFWISLLFGLFGVDHFYARSPITGSVKALTLGGLGLWWLWDVFQLGFEQKRVTLYGLTTPFNFATGIARGAFTEGTSRIVQRTDYFNWIGSALLDLFGITALIEGRPAAFLRRLIDSVLLIAFLSLGTIFGYLMAAIFAFFTLVPAFFTLRAIFDPELLAKKGAPIPQNLIKLLNFFESWTDVIGSNATAVVRHDFGLSAVDATSAQATFGYATAEEVETEQAAASAAASTGSAAGKKKEIQSWPISMLLGNVFGGLVMGVVSLLTWIPQVKLGLFAADTYFAGVRASRGETPDAPDFGSLLPPGIGGIAGSVVPGGLGGLQKMAGTVLPGVAIPSSLRDVAGAAIPGMAGAVLPGDLRDAALRAGSAAGRIEQATAALKGEIAGQKGGARNESLSTEGTVLGATVIALIAGGAIKIAVDSLVGN